MNAGDTAWVLISAALVLLMSPGLAIFYGGMTRVKSMLNMMMMSFGALAIVGVLWITVGYSMSFGPDAFGGLVGNPFQLFGLHGLLSTGTDLPLVGTVPELAFVGFQGVFATVTVALISGAIADRAKFGSWMVFAALWAVLVYFPVAHWVFDGKKAADGTFVGGWLNHLGLIDFAGGTAVEVNAGAAGLALALVLGKRLGFGKDPNHRPHSLPLVMLGCGLLWFGWFGFNAGSALGANGEAAFAWINTLVAPCAAVLSWLVVEKFRDGHATSFGAASGAVAGLVAITPSCASLSPLWSIVLGLVAGAVCALAVGLKYRFGYDDSLDVVGVHLVGGIVGTLFIGLAASPGAPVPGQGLFYGGGFDLLGKQALGTGAVLGYSFAVALAIGLAVKATLGFRVSKDVEEAGVDLAIHAETAYHSDAEAGRAFHPLGTKAGGGARPAPIEPRGESVREPELVTAGSAATVSP
ncbi:ammonium transporter [Sinomonas sp. JGH33]|uniref:Ammonium transporter n=1 Tax=Sinomonas terricola TaxID=3110330 RepID=A0ABU5TA67_9MICC|nr:ammonium transporter [Sinomonas sp. JGH33]MEA5456564.1 ammonium transporter [Sinomonas sp. JGH33]